MTREQSLENTETRHLVQILEEIEICLAYSADSMEPNVKADILEYKSTLIRTLEERS